MINLKYIKFGIKLLIVSSLIKFSTFSFCQKLEYSELHITYDYKSLTADKSIPFDKAFTLSIPKLSSKGIKYIHLYESEIIENKSFLVTNSFKDYDDSPVTVSVKDKILGYNKDIKSLEIFIPPLKPNKNFDVNIAYQLNTKSRELLLETNSLCSQSLPTQAATKYREFFKSTIDQRFNRSNTTVNLITYAFFYALYLSPKYSRISTVGNYLTGSSITKRQAQAIGKVFGNLLKEHNKISYLFKLLDISKSLPSLNDGFQFVELGIFNIKDIYNQDLSKLPTMHDVHLRVNNLKENISYFKELEQNLHSINGNSINNVIVNGISVNLIHTISRIKRIIKNLENNYNFIKDEFDEINKIINKHAGFSTGYYLSGGTENNNLKTEGGYLFFLDGGISNITTRNLQDEIIQIPKLSTGINIYFRPIDKNTRLNKLPKRNRKRIHYGLDGNGNYGPDFGVISTKSIWHNLSLHIGFTINAIDREKEGLADFFNESSLLLGPSYRFLRVFKISAGLAFHRISSQNPFRSEKEGATGAFMSLTIDADFFQILGDLFKPKLQ